MNVSHLTLDSDGDDDDDDIVMPDGPPPGGNREAKSESDDDDDTPMPEGPPPPKGPPPGNSLAAMFVYSFYQCVYLALSPFSLPLPPSAPSTVIPGFPHGLQPPSSFAVLPFPPAVPVQLSSPFLGQSAAMPAHPPGFTGHTILPPLVGFPPPPPGFFSGRQHAPPSLMQQDPLSSQPHKSFQAHRVEEQVAKSRHRPAMGTDPSAESKFSTATISAAPELRDFKKEATAFVPTALKRKKATVSKISAPKLNSAPETADLETPESAVATVRPDIVDALKEQFGPVPVANRKATRKGKDGYEKFLEEMGDILGPSR